MILQFVPRAVRSRVASSPALQSEAPRPVSPLRRVPAQRARIGAAGTVLVVSPEPHMRRFIRAGLEGHAFAVIEADGLDTIPTLPGAVRSPDLVVLDVGAGSTGEHDVMRMLRERPDAPLIVLSNASCDASPLLRIGAADHLHKPVGLVELAARCQTALRRGGRRHG